MKCCPFLAVILLAFVSGHAQSDARNYIHTSTDAIARDTAAIIALEQRDAAAAKINDIEKLVSLWTPDGVLLLPRADAVEGIAAIRQLFEAQKQQTSAVETLAYSEGWKERRIFGDEAYEWGQIKITARFPDGRELTQTVSALRILRRTHGSWKIARAIITPGPHEKQG